jgi:glucose/arabinose dehydrogenase
MVSLHCSGRWSIRALAFAVLVAFAACGSDKPAPGPAPGDGGTPDGGDGGAADGSVGPDAQPFSPALLEQLQKPAGFAVGVFAADLPGARMLAVGPEGSVYVTRKSAGDVIRLRDADGDGKAEVRGTAVAGIEGVHGIAVQSGKLFLASPKYVFAGALSADGAVAMPMAVVLDLPAGGDHPDRAIGFGSDGKLYISIGSSCESCAEADPEHASMLQTTVTGADRVVLARGLHNTVGFGWHPMTGELWAADEGIAGATPTPDELNRITMGGHYGWPYCYGKRQANTAAADPAGMTKEVFCRNTQSAALEIGSRGAPFGFVFYGATQFPAEYRGSAFLALRGSVGQVPFGGFKVVRVRFASGQPMAVEDFVTGFSNAAGTTFFARPSGLAVAADGALLMADDANGIVYRVSYTGN